MTIQSSQIVQIKYQLDTFNKSFVYVELLGSGSSHLGVINNVLSFEYGLDPSDANVIAALEAYQRDDNAAEVISNDFVNDYSETKAAFDALPMGSTRKKPFQYMVDQNYFLRTNNPTNTEFSDVSSDSGQNSGNQIPTITTYPVYLRRNYQNPPTVGPNATYVGASTDSIVVDGWDTTTLNGWATPNQTPASAGSGDMLFIATAMVELQPDNSYSRSEWVISPSIDGLSHQYSYDGTHTIILTGATFPTDFNAETII